MLELSRIMSAVSPEWDAKSYRIENASFTAPKYLVTLIIINYFAALKLSVFCLLLNFSPMHSGCLIVLLPYMFCLCVPEILAVLLPLMVKLC